MGITNAGAAFLVYGNADGLPARLALSLDDLGLSAADVAPVSRVRRMYAPERGKAELITGSAAEQAARLAQIIKELRGM